MPESADSTDLSHVGSAKPDNRFLLPDYSTVAQYSGVRFHPQTMSLEDKGYQGMARYHANSFIPYKKPKDGELSESERDYNRALSGERYRNRRKRYGLRFNLIAALYNHERAIAAW